MVILNIFCAHSSASVSKCVCPHCSALSSHDNAMATDCVGCIDSGNNASPCSLLCVHSFQEQETELQLAIDHCMIPSTDL